MRLLSLSLCIVVCLIVQICPAQDGPSNVDKLLNFPNRFIQKMEQQSSKMEERLLAQTEKYLAKLAKQEQRIYRKLKKIDSAAAAQLFAESNAKYADLLDSIKKPDSIAKNSSGEYLPYVDSIKASLSFLQQNGQFINSSKELRDKIDQSLGQFKQLQSRLAQSDYIKQFIRERREQIRQTFSRYTNLPGSLKKELDQFNQQIYYYTQQVKEFRDMLNDPDKLTVKALSLLNKIPAFSNFLKEHSELAGLFSIPGGYGSTQGIAGLQTTDQVRQLVMNQVGSGPDAMNALQQNLQSAQAQLSRFKDKINQLGGGSGDIDMPNFKPNNEKVKTFWKRLEYGTNLQSTRANYFFPNYTDLGLSVGYKISGKSIVGVGMSYKVGWGKDIRHITVTSEGIGFRSFFDMKIKSSFFASAGFEYNYQQPFNNLNQLKGLNNWHQSGLAGITKIVSLKSKLFKKTKAQLLWDFLSYRQQPVGQPIKFRVGYNF